MQEQNEDIATGARAPGQAADQERAADQEPWLAFTRPWPRHRYSIYLAVSSVEEPARAAVVAALGELGLRPVQARRRFLAQVAGLVFRFKGGLSSGEELDLKLGLPAVLARVAPAVELTYVAYDHEEPEVSALAACAGTVLRSTSCNVGRLGPVGGWHAARKKTDNCVDSSR